LREGGKQTSKERKDPTEPAMPREAMPTERVFMHLGKSTKWWGKRSKA